MSALEELAFHTSRERLSNYYMLEKIGEGTYGMVYRALHLPTQKHVALKIIRLDSFEEGAPSSSVREISILKQLQHPNIIKLYEIVQTETSLTLGTSPICACTCLVLV